MPRPDRAALQPPIDVVAGVIEDDGRILITQRMPGDTLAGYWEFPGGKVESGEERRAALRRELQEELGIETEVGAQIYACTHAYPDRDVRLFFYATRVVAGEPQRLEVADLTWVTPAELMNYQFPAADLPLLRQLNGQ